LARSGFNVVLVSRREEKLEEVKREIGGIDQEIRVKVVPMDLANADDYAPITADKEVSDNLAIVVNNAGLNMDGRFLDIAPEKLQNELRLNLNAVTLLSRYARNSFSDQLDLSSNPDQERFGIINVSSTVSLEPFPGVTQYSATKRYSDDFTKAIRDSCLKRNIDCLVVLPGMVTTTMSKNTVIPGTTCLPE